MKKVQTKVIWDASKMVFKNKRYKLALICFIVVIFWLFIFVPVTIVPGNDIPFQLSIMPKSDFLILTILSILTSISLLFQIYIFRRSKVKRLEQIGQATATGSMGIVSSILGTVTCIACASTVLGFLGIGTVTFALKYRFALASFSVLVMIVSLYFNSKKVLNLCQICNVKYKI